MPTRTETQSVPYTYVLMAIFSAAERQYLGGTRAPRPYQLKPILYARLGQVWVERAPGWRRRHSGRVPRGIPGFFFVLNPLTRAMPLFDQGGDLPTVYTLNLQPELDPLRTDALISGRHCVSRAIQFYSKKLLETISTSYTT